MIWSLPLQMGGGAGGSVPFALFGPWVGLLVVGAIGYVLWSAIGEPSSAAGDRPDEAMETLRRRYAAGDIDAATFEERARTLRER